MQSNDANSANPNMMPVYDRWFILRFLLAIIITPLIPFSLIFIFTYLRGMANPMEWDGIKFWGEMFAVTAYVVEVLFAPPVVWAMVVTRNVRLVHFIFLGASSGIATIIFIALMAGRINKLFGFEPIHDFVLGALLGTTYATFFWFIARPDKIALRAV